MANKKVLGKIHLSSEEANGNYWFLRLDNNYYRNRVFYKQDTMKIEIISVYNSNNDDVLYSIEKLKCGREICKIPYQAGGVDVNYEIVIDIYDRIIRFEDSIYGGVACYPRIIEKEMQYPCLDCHKADYSVQFSIQRNCIVVTSGMITQMSNFDDIAHFYLSNSLGFPILVADKIDYISGSARNVILKAFFFTSEKSEFDNRVGRRVLEAAQKCINEIIRVIGFFPCKTLYLLPGNKYYQGGYVSNKIIYINYFNIQHLEEKHIYQIIMHEIAHLYFGVELNDDYYYGKCLSKSLSMWLESYMNPSIYQDIKIDHYEFNFMPICQYQKDNKINFDWNYQIYHIEAYKMITWMGDIIGSDLFFKRLCDLMNKYKNRLLYVSNFINEMKMPEIANFFATTTDCPEDFCLLCTTNTEQSGL